MGNDNDSLNRGEDTDGVSNSTAFLCKKFDHTQTEEVLMSCIFSSMVTLSVL